MNKFLKCSALILLIAACQQKKPEVIVVQEEVSLAPNLASLGPEKLSSYHFFEGDLKNLQPAKGVIGYSLNSPLFSDYAFKKRFVKIPKGKEPAELTLAECLTLAENAPEKKGRFF